MMDSLEETWDERQVKQLHADIVTGFLQCEDDISVNASVEYAKFVCQQGLNKENYPFFMSLFIHKNDDFIEALLGDGTILKSLLGLHINPNLVFLCFELLKRFSPRETNEKTLETVLQVVGLNYRSAFAGYRTYPLTAEDLYYIGKFLDPDKPQSSSLNRIILDILGDLGELNSKDIPDAQMNSIGSHANQIRNGFFDKTLVMDTVMPYSLLGGKQN